MSYLFWTAVPLAVRIFLPQCARSRQPCPTWSRNGAPVPGRSHGLSRQAPADEHRFQKGHMNKNTPSGLRERASHGRTLNFFPCHQSTSSLSSLQLTISWQNVKGKFHGWWRCCENVTLRAINKEVWLRLGEPFFTGVCFAVSSCICQLFSQMYKFQDAHSHSSIY